MTGGTESSQGLNVRNCPGCQRLGLGLGDRGATLISSGYRAVRGWEGQVSGERSPPGSKLSPDAPEMGGRPLRD
jgi:hypothetical protein